MATQLRSQRLRTRRDQLISQYQEMCTEEGQDDALYHIAWETTMLEEQLAVSRRLYWEMSAKYEPASVPETDVCECTDRKPDVKGCHCRACGRQIAAQKAGL